MKEPLPENRKNWILNLYFVFHSNKVDECRQITETGVDTQVIHVGMGVMHLGKGAIRAFILRRGRDISWEVPTSLVKIEEKIQRSRYFCQGRRESWKREAVTLTLASKGRDH